MKLRGFNKKYSSMGIKERHEDVGLTWYGVNCLLNEKDRFYQGVVSALDVIAIYNDLTIFQEIVEACGVDETLKEIKKNGSKLTKKIARQIWNTQI